MTESKNVSATKIAIMKNNNNKQLKTLTNSDVKQTGSRLLRVNESVIYKKKSTAMKLYECKCTSGSYAERKSMAFVTNAIKMKTKH